MIGHLNIKFGDCNTTAHHKRLIITLCTGKTKGDTKTHLNTCKYHSFDHQQEMPK